MKEEELFTVSLFDIEIGLTDLSLDMDAPIPIGDSVWLWDDGGKILWDDGSAIKL